MKKVVRLTENDLTRLVNKVIKEQYRLNEYFGSDGEVTVNIEGDGNLVHLVENEIKQALKGFKHSVMDRIELYVNGEQVDLYKKSPFSIKEYFGSHGEVTVNIEGDGNLVHFVQNQIKQSLKGFRHSVMDRIELYVNGEQVDLYKKSPYSKD